jgi:spore coat polysaccharide biosynthesis protein SpsF
MKINISIEARMTSTRLPGKTLMLINGKPSLEIMVDRIKKAKLFDNIIVATTINKADDAIVDWCIKNGVKYFRGSENNVYDRVVKANQKFNTDVIVELTGDCILLDADLVDDAIKTYLDNEYDYVSLEDPVGMGVQVYSLEILESVSHDRELEYQDKEHVTPYIYTSGKYNISKIKVYEDLDCPDVFLVLDTIEDWKVINNVCKNFDNFDFPFKEIVKFMQKHPDKVSANKLIRRKGLA